MHIFLSPKKKNGLLVIVFVALLVLMMALIVEAVSNETWLFLPEIAFTVAILTILGCLSYLQINKKISLLINETLDSLASGVIYFDKSGALARFNPAAAVMLPNISDGESSENFIGTYKRFLAYVYDHSLDIQDQSRLTLDLSSMNLSKLLFREVVDFNHRVVLVQFYQRDTADIVSVLTDISMMKRHIDEVAMLTEENRIMIKAMEAAGSSMMIAEVRENEASVVFANDMFARTIRQPIENILNHSFPEILEKSFEEQITLIREGIVTAKREGSVSDIFLKMRPDKKTVLWYAVYILFFRDTNDKEFFVCFLSDQTQARLSQAKIYQSQKLEAVAQLAGGIAHDFNNILSVIYGFTNLMKKGVGKGADITSFFENIDRSVQRGTEITERLLAFGQRRVTQKIRLDICEHVKAMESFISPMTDSSINMIVSVEDDPCYVDASPDAITQIMMSLAHNACEAMPKGGDLIISVAQASKSQILGSQKAVIPYQNYACIQMIDSGCGMNAETLSRIYEPFFTTKDPAKNSGLGMSLVYGLVKEMDAFIDIKSTADVGASVSILIPLKEAPSRALFTQPVQRNPDILKGKTILIVEDSPDILEMEYQLLTEARLNVLKASNADEAFGLREKYQGRIDFLLVDVSLPEMNGVELSCVFEEISPETQIILISGYPVLGPSEKQGALPEGKIILAKPLVYERLEEVLVSSLEENSKQNLTKSRHWVEHENIT